MPPSPKQPTHGEQHKKLRDDLTRSAYMQKSDEGNQMPLFGMGYTQSHARGCGIQGADGHSLPKWTWSGRAAKNMTNRTILTIEMDLTPVPCRAKRFTPRAYACGVSGSDRDTCVRPSTPRLRPSRRDPTVAGGDAFLIRTNYMPYTTVGRFYMNRSHAKACRFSHVAERATASTYDRYNAGTSRGRAPRFADSNLVPSWWARAQVAILTVAGSKCGARQVAYAYD